MTLKLLACPSQLQELRERKRAEEEVAAANIERVAPFGRASSAVVVEADMGFHSEGSRPRAPRQVLGRAFKATPLAAFAEGGVLASSAQGSESSMAATPASSTGDLEDRSSFAGGLSISVLSSSPMSSWKLSTTNGLTGTAALNRTENGDLTIEEKVQKQLAELDAVVHQSQDVMMGEHNDGHQNKPDPVQALKQAGDAAASLRERLKLNHPQAKVGADALLEMKRASHESWQSAEKALRSELQQMPEMPVPSKKLGGPDQAARRDGGRDADTDEDGDGERALGTNSVAGAPWLVQTDK